MIITIANSDAGWNSYTHEAIDQAWRAVNELKSARLCNREPVTPMAGLDFGLIFGYMT